ncbi:MAG: RdgB/HAM1 family non-canonical purine NTP pyrophosphatase [Gammaproteobacteria bacterium]|nr:RdgB/HAM1 family non-canonical purine NTP pyrophosphatase [Gammaproteobacteria bacterium]
MTSPIVLASNNAKKIKELQEILIPFEFSIVTQASLGIEDAVEDGLSFVENAIKKARHASLHSKMPAISDDSGIEVDALKGAPGIYSARFAGEHGDDQANNKKLLAELKGIPQDKRTARYQCVIVFMRHASDPTPIICQGSWEGIILDSPQGEGGFGYDPLFYVPEHKCTAAELSAEKKHQLSHRGAALNQLVKQITQLKRI